MTAVGSCSVAPLISPPPSLLPPPSSSSPLSFFSLPSPPSPCRFSCTLILILYLSFSTFLLSSLSVRPPDRFCVWHALLLILILFFSLFLFSFRALSLPPFLRLPLFPLFTDLSSYGVVIPTPQETAAPTLPGSPRGTHIELARMGGRNNRMGRGDRGRREERERVRGRKLT